MAEGAGIWIGDDGWVATSTEDGVDVHIRVRPRADGQLVVTGVLIEAEEVTTDTLRHVYPARILAAAAMGAQPSTRSWRLSTSDGRPRLTDSPPIEGEPFSVPVDVSVDRDALLKHYADADDGGTTLGDLRSRTKRQLQPEKREPLGRPGDFAAVGRPDDFYSRFAAAYRSAAIESNKPAVILSEENGVPVETIRRWTKEARRRGHLEAGRKGRAG